MQGGNSIGGAISDDGALIAVSNEGWCYLIDALSYVAVLGALIAMRVPPARQPYHAAAHTGAAAVGRVATQGRAKLLVLTHVLFFGASEEQLLKEVRSTFTGPVVVARDIGRY